MHICKGWKLTHCKFTTWLFTLLQKGVLLCMLPSYPSCNIHLILKVYVGNKYILEQYLQQFRWVNHQSGGVEWGGPGTLSSMRGGGLYPSCSISPKLLFGAGRQILQFSWITSFFTFRSFIASCQSVGGKVNKIFVFINNRSFNLP